MATRIINTTRNNNQQLEDLNKLKEMLIKSKYPMNLIEKSIQNCLQQNNSYDNNKKTQLTNKKDEEMKFSLCLPYARGMEMLKRKLEKLHIKLFFSYSRKLNSLIYSNMKPQSKSVVYQMDCECGASYNGETKVGLKKRAEQHNKLIEKHEETANSEIVQHHHSKKWQCMFDSSLSYVVDTETNYIKRRIKEAIFSSINNSINQHKLIDVAWNNILCNEQKSIKEMIKLKKNS